MDVKVVFIADRETMKIEELTLEEAKKIYGVSEKSLIEKAKNCEQLYSSSTRFWVCEDMVDAWECL